MTKTYFFIRFEPAMFPAVRPSYRLLDSAVSRVATS